MGAFAGFYGGWLDSLLSRIGDIFFSIPYILAAVVVMSVFSQFRNVFTLAFAIGGFAWAATARVVRAEVLRVRQSDFVTASRALGLVAIPHAREPRRSERDRAAARADDALSLAAAIVAEATLSFLGVGSAELDHVVGQRHQPGPDVTARRADGADLSVDRFDRHGPRVHHAG